MFSELPFSIEKFLVMAIKKREKDNK